MENNPMDEGSIRDLVRNVIQEFVQVQQAKSEPAYKTELLDERKRREQLENRVNQLMEENRRSKLVAEELDRGTTIRSELQRLGVAKLDLAFKAVKDDITRGEDGRLVARSDHGEVSLREYLTEFVNGNPELLPARISGGSGASGTRSAPAASTFDLDKIKPGMSAEELERARQEIARVALQSIR
jgi:hypothetical protein